MAERLKVMVVDDTITYRMIMKKVAESIPGIVVTASASNGKLAMAKIESDKPDVVLLDIEMPVMDGLATLKEITHRYPEITTVMVSGVSRSNANIVMECLSGGALDFVTKPLETNANRAKEALRKDLQPILSIIARKKAMTPTASTARPAVEKTTPSSTQPAPRTASDFGRTPPVRPATPVRPGSPSAPVARTGSPAQPAARPAVAQSRPMARPGKPGRPELLLIGSSTGGPAALAQVLAGIKQPLSIPTLIVQHMPPVFTASLCTQLSRSSGLTVVEAQEGLALQPGSITLAMGGKHMVLQKKPQGLVVGLNDGPKVNECRPAVDVLFMSVLGSGFEGKILSVILTGMGRDGANGVDALKRMGKTYSLTQSKETCVVYGMPRSVEEMGLSDEVLPLGRIGRRIVELCS
ncbi:MAG: chemotaxis-specific protein-glutamate methyltransferase CheB [Magnetococcales bacterium]|nr:chemotaxis-specific protein-glutamate methyltransferase CheB [Magnetococcales bacterium]